MTRPFQNKGIVALKENEKESTAKNMFFLLKKPYVSPGKRAFLQLFFFEGSSIVTL